MVVSATLIVITAYFEKYGMKLTKVQRSSPMQLLYGIPLSSVMIFDTVPLKQTTWFSVCKIAFHKVHACILTCKSAASEVIAHDQSYQKLHSKLTVQ